MSDYKLFFTIRDHDSFSTLPKDILYVLLSFLPSFKELGRMACVAKLFNNIITEDEQLFKEICIRIWNEDESLNLLKSSLRKLPLIGEQNILEWIRKIMISFNLDFSWKWIAQCMQRYNGLEYKYSSDSRKLQIGSFDTTMVYIHSSFLLGSRLMYIKPNEFDGTTEKVIIVYTDGTNYQGEADSFSRDGEGTLTYPKGVRYVGQFKKNLIHGEGTLIWKDGFSIKSEWQYNTPIGSRKNELMHPILKEQVKKGLCTAGKNKQKHSQPMWICTRSMDCEKLLLCATCRNHSKKYSDHEHDFQYLWFINEKCDCEEEHCKYE